MFIELLQTDPRRYFAVVIVVIVSIVLHELAHGWAAISRGDDTPVRLGHMTPNPLVHMPPISLLMLCLIGIAWGLMPVDHSRMRGRYAEAFVAAAGPAINIVLAVLAITALGLLIRYNVLDPANHTHGNLLLLLQVMGHLNIALAIFNMIPVPPLDGSAVLANFSRGYRNLLSRPEVLGAMSAAFFVLFIVGGSFIFIAAERLMLAYLSLFGVGRG